MVDDPNNFDLIKISANPTDFKILQNLVPDGNNSVEFKRQL